MEQEQEKLNKTLDDFAERKLLPAVGKMMDEKLSNYPTKEDLAKHPTKADLDERLTKFATKEDMDEKLERTEKNLMRMFAEFTDNSLIPGISKTVREIITEELRNYPTRADLEDALKENKEEIIARIRKKIEPMHRHQVVVTDVIEQRGCAVADQMGVLKESVS